MKKTKFALLQSVIALLLCMSMLIGTTFAWFTDSVTSGNNIIAAGNLDIELEYLDNGTWKKVTDSTNVFKNDTLWEPGHTEVVYLKVSNAGTLALKYQLGVNIAKEVGSVNQAGESFLLSDYIYFGTVEGVSQAYADRAAARAAVTTAEKISTGYAKTGTMEKGAEPQYVAMVVYMPEETGNAANYATGENPPSITLGIELLATQMTSESDSYDKTYDDNAAADFFPGFQGGTAGAAVTTDAQGMTTAETAVEGGDVSAVIPANVLVEDGVTTLTLTVTQKDTSNANVQLNADEEMRPLDVHIEGVAAGNTVPMLITLEHYLTTGINTGALRLYHVENGATVAMTQVANPVNHNEFSYDPATGNVTLALASFSEVAVVADTNNPWDGEARNYLWYDASATELTIYNADQLAGFADIVDGKAKGIAQDSFAGKTVKLANNITLSGKLFDPIGWGYENSSWNRDGADGKVFKGTFDGGKYDKNGNLVGSYTIFDLHQSGWDLESETGTDYTYTNCGFGLFAAASNATFQNLIVSGAYVRAECVEMGVLVGLSQNSCTYDNIKIVNSKIANYQRPAGGLIGEVSGDGTTTITNVAIGSDVVVGSLWGDFDAPVGGVIGARWDDIGADPEIVMSYVDVGCRLDVYNDVTAAYQWHAYRRAGMLIGNTDTPAANGKTAQVATADFLECKTDDNGNETVIVHLGSWANYHYCRFSKQDIEWQNNYPWVRVEAGENNSAYSNPRYGHPIVNGVEVVDGNHTCDGGDHHNMQISFAQLYGGGQGVYGQPIHEGVKTEGYLYSIFYVNNDEVISIQYVTEDDVAGKDVFIPNDSIAQTTVENWVKAQGYTVQFDCWVSAGSKKVEIPVSNRENVTVYPSFVSPYTARFVDLDGNVLDWCFFNEKNSDIVETEASAKKLLPPQDENVVRFSGWEVHYYGNNGNVVTEAYSSSKFVGNDCYKTDVTIYPIYTYDGDVNLIPVDKNGDGRTDEYYVGGYSNPNGQDLVRIPGEVLGIPVTAINANAFSSYDGVHAVVIPKSITTVGGNALAVDWSALWGKGETVTIYYEGSRAEWLEKEKNFTTGWDDGLGESSRIFFLNGTGKVDSNEGYMQAKADKNWLGIIKSLDWDKKDGVDSLKGEYTGKCDCDDCDGATRPDAKFWN